jgi:hypothetical protein
MDQFVFVDYSYNDYLLRKIDTVKYKHNNLLYFEKNKRLYVFVSEKVRTNKCDKLELNKTYNLYSPGEFDNKNMDPIFQHLDGEVLFNEGVAFDNSSPNIVRALIVSPSIEGLCYFKW